MLDLLTNVLLAGAAGTTLAWLVAAQRRLVAHFARRFLALPRLQQVALLLAVGVMTVCAQKSGSNVVFNAEIEETQSRGEEVSASPSATSNTSVLRVKTSLTSSANPCESVQSVVDTESESLSNDICSLFTVHCSLSTNDLSRGFALTRVGTNEAFDFSAPEGANYATNWMLHGGATARTCLRFDDWTFPFGDGCPTNLTAFMFGVIAPDLYNEDLRIAPLQASLGFIAGGLDFVNAEILENGSRGEDGSQVSASPSLLNLRVKTSSFWHLLTPSNSLVITWQNVLLHRLSENLVSFQVEFFANGDFTYRYDFSQLPSDAVLTNAYVIAAPGIGEPFVLGEYSLTRRFRSLGGAEEIFEEGVS